MAICTYCKQEEEIHIEFIENRLGQDYRYSISSEKLRTKLKWKPRENYLFNFTKEN